MAKIVLNLIVALVSTLIAVTLGELALSWMGYPQEYLPPPASHEAGLVETRKHIEFSYVFKTNSQGLRYREVPLQQHPFSFRAFVVGDSYTEGWGVAEDETFVSRLEDHFTRPDRPALFINGGVTGTGPVAYRRVFFEIGAKYQPDALLICLFANDLANTPATPGVGSGSPASSRSASGSLVHFLWPRTATLVQRFEAQRRSQRRTHSTDFIQTVSIQARRRGIPEARIHAWKADVPRDLVEAVERGEFVGAYLSRGLLDPGYWTESLDLSSREAEEKWRRLAAVLAEIIEDARRTGVEPAVVFIPSRFQYDPRSHRPANPWIASGSRIRKAWLTEDTELQRRLRTWSQDHEVPFLDLATTFRAAVRSGQRVNWDLDGHWNSLGHEVAAEAIAVWLLEQDVFAGLGSESENEAGARAQE